MVRSLTFLPAMMCAAAIVAAQTPAQDRPTTNPPAAGQPTTQQPTTPASQPPSMPSGQMATAAKVTYSGCVKPGTTAGTWILENADLTPAAGMAGQASSTAPGQAGQSPVGTSGAMKTTLNLTVRPGTDLKPHANPKIEVTGTIAPSKSAAQAVPQAGQQSSTSASVHQEFSVESVKMVSATCP
jgi:hypothetical protein